MLEQHPVPQNVTSFQFRLIGDMTLKQFAYLAGGAILAYISWMLPLPFFFRYPFAAIFGLGGIGFAFVPVEERPMDVWFVSFIRSIYSPTQYLWQREEKITPPANAVPVPGQAGTPSSAKTTGMMIPSVLPVDSITKLITQFTNTLQQTATTMKQKRAYSVPKSAPVPVSQKPVAPPPVPKPVPPTQVPPHQTAPPQQPHKEEPQGKAQAAPPQLPNRPTFQTVVVPQVPGVTTVAQNKPVLPVPQPIIAKPMVQPVKHPIQQPSLRQPVNSPVQQQAPQQTQQNTQLEQRLKQMEAQLQQHGVDQQRLKDLEAKLEQATVEKQKLEELVKRQTTQPPVPQHAPPATPPVVVQAPQPQKPTVSVFTPQGARSAGIPTITTFANVVSGIVRERNGNLLVGVLVTVKDKEDVPVRALKTNKLGQFAASTPLLNGTYTLEVEDPKRQFTFDQARVILQGNVLPPLEIIAKSQQELERAKLEQAVFGKKDVT